MRLPYRLPGSAGTPQETLLALLLGGLGGSILVTHWFAGKAGFHSGLGEPLLASPLLRLAAFPAAVATGLALLWLLRTRPLEPPALVLGAMALPTALALTTGRLYAPLAWVRWRADLAAVAPGDPSLEGLLGDLDRALAAAGGSALLLALVRVAATGPARGDVQGSARFATSAEIRRLGLRKGATGVVVGGERRAGQPGFLYAPDRRHVGIFGPSGCGKTTKVVIPTLLSETASMVVLDIKMELYALTAGYRQRALGHTVHAFAPSIDAPWVSGYNPLLDIPRGPQEVAYSQAIALALIDPEGQIRTPDFWHASAMSLLTASILHVLYVGPDRSLAGVHALLASPAIGIRERLEQMMATEHDPERLQGWSHPETGEDTPTHPVVCLEAAKLLDLAPETWTGIVATARSKLSLFLDPIVAANTRRHDFTLAGLGETARPTTLYLVLPARDLGRLAGLLRLFLQQLSFHTTGALATESDSDGRPRPAARSRRQLVLLLDELAAVGKLDLIARQIAYLRGYGIQVVAAVQTVHQLYDVYGQHESVRGNLGYLLVFPSTEHRTAEEISKLLGDQTLYVETRSRSSAESIFASRRTTTVRDQRRPLLTPDEVRRLSNDTPILLATGAFPILTRMAGFYAVKGFRRRTERAPSDRRHGLLPGPARRP